ncbi:hypothetical protein E2C01_082386 [Portunus trituberculatus]|uniref:Uncharacterized protein n=1 Tax=Portunus trituberculatus TaxID=210409 RepID=A0A5B7J4T7_PORTR|nr:hypothetical protein [Portunus trituberculatus]
MGLQELSIDVMRPELSGERGWEVGSREYILQWRQSCDVLQHTGGLWQHRASLRDVLECWLRRRAWWTLIKPIAIFLNFLSRGRRLKPAVNRPEGRAG